MAFHGKSPLRSPLKKKRGFTLLEIMVSMVLFTIVALSATVALMQAFKTLVKSRYRDRAINVLNSVAEQFHNSRIYEAAGGGVMVQELKTFFRKTDGAATGTGMAWNVRLQVFAYPGTFPADWTAGTDYILPANDGTLSFPLRTAGVANQDTPIATLTRQVEFVDPATGLADDDFENTVTPAGRLVQAIFTIRYQLPLERDPTTLSTTVLRNLNPTDR